MAKLKYSCGVFERSLRKEALKIAWLIASFGLLAWTGNVPASEALARQHGCFSCHAVDRKVVGPAYKDVAAKYRGDAGAEARLIEKLRRGGERTWGEIFMSPMETVPEGDIKILVRWILSLT
ncbi:MAG: c-type cytochrome [Pseudomonadota bacterium]